jgi:hypothetical protein
MHFTMCNSHNYFCLFISELQEKDVQEDVRWELALMAMPFQGVLTVLTT